MLEATKQRTADFQRRLQDEGIDLALVTDEDSIAYLAGFWGYLGVEFGRPTFLLVPKDGAPVVITPLMESEMVTQMTWVEDIRPWEDDGPNRWEAVLAKTLGALGAAAGALGIETAKTPPMVAAFLAERGLAAGQCDISRLLGEMRMIKTPDEIEIMRQGGQVALAMVEAGRAALGEGVPEYEVALAVMQGGTRKAAGFLTDKGWEAFVSPLIYNLQVMQSGSHTAMVHRRSSVKRLERGDPVYMCFCNMVRFKQYKLGFDRQFFIGAHSDEQAHIYEKTVEAQLAALATIAPGVAAEEVHLAAEEVYRSAGFAPGYRTGRAIGASYIESPELKAGDKTVLREGMTFAVDGGITVPKEFGARVGDSIVVTGEGFDYLTPYPKDLCVV
jgi:Xaa-Pro aminopeptidase